MGFLRNVMLVLGFLCVCALFHVECYVFSRFFLRLCLGFFRDVTFFFTFFVRLFVGFLCGVTFCARFFCVCLCIVRLLLPFFVRLCLRFFYVLLISQNPRRR